MEVAVPQSGVSLTVLVLRRVFEFLLTAENCPDFGRGTSACQKMHRVKLWWQTSNAE
jgi:hypothetical protein